MAQLLDVRRLRTPLKFMSDPSFDKEIAKLQLEVSELHDKHSVLRRKFEAREREMAHYFYLIDEKKRLERENAALEGRPYHDEDDPDDYQEPPEPPDA